MDRVIEFLTSETGVVAALLVLITLIGGILGLVRPFLKARREKRAATPELCLAAAKAKQPPAWSDAGEVSFQLVNQRGGQAVMTEMRLVVLECGDSEKTKKVEPAAPVTQYTYKVRLSRNVETYDVRAKKFGPKPEPHSFGEGEVESYVLEITSEELLWYRFVMEVEWYDGARSGEIRTLTSDELELEFVGEC
jgi:hypothetical protein